MSVVMVAADSAGVSRAVDALGAGQLVILPTETVYGLGADATNGAAVARIYAAKGRPRINPLIAHVPDLDRAEREAVFDPRARDLALAFWPGPLTLVLPRRPDSTVSLLALAGLDSIALRSPADSAFQAVLRRLDRPICAPSANRSGALSPTTAADAASAFAAADVALALDHGRCKLGVESTIVALSPGAPAQLLRPGALDRAEIEALIGPLAAAGDAVQAPGMLASHYAPNALVRLNADRPGPDEVMLGFGAIAGDVNLSPAGDLIEAAANLFGHLRALDRCGAKSIAVAPIPPHGLGEAINDRLARAAAPRG
jgi:L-threonylcarbamoyladenylate synthase